MKIPDALGALYFQIQEHRADDGYVYFLVDGQQVVYVGQTTNLAARVRDHLRDGKQYRRVLFVSVAREQMDSVELHWITKLDPKYNRRHTDRAAPNGQVAGRRLMPTIPPDVYREMREHPDSIELLGLRRATACRLYMAGFRTASSVLAAEPNELLAVSGFGELALRQIRGLNAVM